MSEKWVEDAIAEQEEHIRRQVAGSGDFGAGIHPPIMHTGPGCSWCKNAGLTQDEIDALTKWIGLLHDADDGPETSIVEEEQ